MKTANEVWPVALKHFADAYGSEPDLTDEVTDRPVFLRMLEEEIREDIAGKLAPRVASATKRIAAIDTGSRVI